MAICDLNYDNLLSFTAWADSPSSGVAPGCSGTITTNKILGRVTSEGSGDFYTLYYTGDSSLYYIPVQAGQQYLFRFDADIVGGVQAYVFYFNDSYAVVNNASGVYFDGIYGSNNLYFTPPSGCTQITFRIGTTNGSKVVFSNLAIYKTSWNTHEITNRQYRKVFTVGRELGILYEPERPGYVFQGWYTGENGTGDLIRKIDFNGSRPILSGNTTVYSHWKKRDYYDVNYDNLFSFSDWAYSLSGDPKGMSDNASYIGTITTNIPNGTITVSGADPNGSGCYTAYGSFAPYHHIPVEPGQEYVFTYDHKVTSGNGGIQVFVFFCTDSQSFFPETGYWLEVRTDGTPVEFTAPADCTNVCFRLGIGGISTVVFSNIGLYKKVDYNEETKKPICRDVRKNVAMGSTVGTLSTPSKEGYDFKGWFTGDNGTGSQVTSASSFEKGMTVYSAWERAKLPIKWKTTTGEEYRCENVYIDDANSTIYFVSDFSTNLGAGEGVDTVDGWHIRFVETPPTGLEPVPELYVNGEMIYKFITEKTYIIRFLDYDGTVLKTEMLEEGTMPTPPNPSKTGWEFNGWDSDVTAVAGNKTYIARYIETGSIDAYVSKYGARSSSSYSYPDDIWEEGSYYYSQVSSTSTPYSCQYYGMDFSELQNKKNVRITAFYIAINARAYSTSSSADSIVGLKMITDVSTGQTTTAAGDTYTDLGGGEKFFYNGKATSLGTSFKELSLSQGNFPGVLEWMNDNINEVINGVNSSSFGLRVNLQYARVKQLCMTIWYSYEP